MDMENERNSGKHKHEEGEFHLHRGEKEEILKERIAKHPLYGLLLEKHLQCLKVGGVNANTERKLIMELERHCKQNNAETFAGSSELDHFMEAYCFALGKLKQAMEEPQTKSLAFINGMHTQLRELKSPSHPPSASAESVGSLD